MIRVFKTIEDIKEIWCIDITQDQLETFRDKHKNDPIPFDWCYATQLKYFRPERKKEFYNTRFIIKCGNIPIAVDKIEMFLYKHISTTLASWYHKLICNIANLFKIGFS